MNCSYLALNCWAARTLKHCLLEGAESLRRARGEQATMQRIMSLQVSCHPVWHWRMQISVRLDAIARLKSSIEKCDDVGEDLGQALLRRLATDDDAAVASAAGEVIFFNI